MIVAYFISEFDDPPPPGWQRGAVLVQMDEIPEKDLIERPLVEAWTRGAFAVHPVRCGGERLGNLTHIPTGLAITAPLPTLADAVTLAHAIEGLTNWHAITERLTPEKLTEPSIATMRAQVNAAVDRLRERALS